jgi:hypothetical protein
MTRLPHAGAFVSRAIAIAIVALAPTGLAGCGPIPKRAAPVPPTLAAWRGALADLHALRDAAQGGGEPHTYKLALALREPFTGRRTEARGAVALSPAQRAVRMILVGPGGTTAFDLWIKADRFRVAIPALDLLRRGDASTPRAEMRGLPVEFLRWWLLDPTRGELAWVDRDAARTRYLLREDGAITTLEVGAHGALVAERRTWLVPTMAPNGEPPARPSAPNGEPPARPSAPNGEPPVLLDEEKVTADKVGCGHARYTQASTGVEIEITCEGVEPNPPSDRAFVDPDAPEPEESE